MKCVLNSSNMGGSGKRRTHWEIASLKAAGYKVTAEHKHSARKCPACGSTNLHASRRRSGFENLSAFAGISYFRCHECKLRFSAYMGGFASRSMLSKYLLMKQRAKELLLASVLLTIVVAALVWMMYHTGEG